MEELKGKVNEKVKNIEDFVALSLRRENIAEEALEILNEAKQLQQLMAKVEEAMQERLAEVEMEHAALMSRMRKQQLAILERILLERQRKMQEAKELEEQVKEAFSKSLPAVTNAAQTQNAQKSLLKSMENLKIQSNVLTPKITLTNYKESPFVKRCRINPIPFVLLDFEYRVTSQQFEMIPKYMRGRETVDELNNFLEAIIIPCFNKKYQLMHRQRNTVRNRNDLELWKVYNEQASYVAGRNFITQGDISHLLNRMMDKKQLNRIVMLRHLGVLQEQRVSQTVCYIWAADAN